MSEQQDLVLKELKSRLEKLDAEFSAYRFAIFYNKQDGEPAIKERKIIYTEFELARHKAGSSELRQISVQSYENILALIDASKPESIVANFYRLAGKGNALLFAINHLDNLEEIESSLLEKTELLSKLPHASKPFMANKRYIEALLEVKNLIQGILDQ